MRVSVIIPVYNAEPFVRQAVESALVQPETAEVILVEDGSPDDSLAICQKLAAEYPIVHPYRHPDGGNHGAGASRNLALRKSTCEYVAFLDADDFYLPGRFSVARELFRTDVSVEGVYEAVGRHVEDEDSARRWEEANLAQRELITMSRSVLPEQLFEALVRPGSGEFHLDGLVVKRATFERAGLFDEHLRLHQDTAMMIKLAAVARLVPGRVDEPVAVRRIHLANRISAPRPQSEAYKMKMMFWTTLWRWSRENLDRERRQILLDRLINRAMFLPRFDRTYPGWMRGFQKRVQLALLLFDHPMLIGHKAFWKRFVPSFKFFACRIRRRLLG